MKEADLYLLHPDGEVSFLPVGWIEETLDTDPETLESFGGVVCRAWHAGPIPAPVLHEHASYHLQVPLRDLVAATPITERQARRLVPHLFHYLDQLDKEDPARAPAGCECDGGHMQNGTACRVCFTELERLADQIKSQGVPYVYIAVMPQPEDGHVWLEVETLPEDTIGGSFDTNSDDIDRARHLAGVLEANLTRRGIHVFHEREHWEASRFATVNAEGNFRWRVTVNGRSDDNEVFSCGTVEVSAPTDWQARQAGIEMLWDPRLQEASCVVDSVELQVIEDEEVDG